MGKKFAPSQVFEQNIFVLPYFQMYAKFLTKNMKNAKSAYTRLRERRKKKLPAQLGRAVHHPTDCSDIKINT